MSGNRYPGTKPGHPEREAGFGARRSDESDVHPEEVTPLTRDEARRFLKAVSEAGDRLQALYVVAVQCGLRQGELLALRWEDVDLVAGTITKNSGKLEIGPTKTE